MKKYALLFVAFFTAACASSPYRLENLVREKCPANVDVMKLYGSSMFGYPSESQKMPEGYLCTWNIKQNYLGTEMTCKFQAFVDKNGKVVQYSVPAYGEPGYESDSLKNYCPAVLETFTGFLGKADAQGNVTCY